MKARYATYATGWSRSLRAELAEEAGRLPLTRAVRVVRAATGCTDAEAREALHAVHDGEWHHVSKFANRVNYYDAAEAIEFVRGVRHAGGFDAYMRIRHERAERAERPPLQSDRCRKAVAEIRRRIADRQAQEILRQRRVEEFRVRMRKHLLPRHAGLSRAQRSARIKEAAARFAREVCKALGREPSRDRVRFFAQYFTVESVQRHGWRGAIVAVVKKHGGGRS